MFAALQQTLSFIITVKIISVSFSIKAGASSPLINIFSIHESKTPLKFTNPSLTLNNFLPSLLTHNPSATVIAFMLKERQGQGVVVVVGLGVVVVLGLGVVLVVVVVVIGSQLQSLFTKVKLKLAPSTPE
jgi:hypothetical protein